MGEAVDTISDMEGKYSGFVLNPSKCSQLTLVEKRELVREIAYCSEDAPQILSSFSRRELLEIICAEMGKERKYTGFTKGRMIERLLKLVSVNTKIDNTPHILGCSPTKTQTGAKRQKNNEYLVQLHTNLDHMNSMDMKDEQDKFLLCENLACKAILSPGYGFCKRCSCCICHRYDDNEDPSLWLTCNSDPPDKSSSCEISCHLKCALKHERAGIMKNGCYTKLDGRFRCVSCGKVNDLMSTWRKQLVVAKEARRVDMLCLRISLCYKILDGTEQYKNLHKHIDCAVKKLKRELGPLDLVCAKMGRGIVKRLVCGAEVQRLCASALETFDNFFNELGPYHADLKKLPTCKVHFEECLPTSVVIVLEYDDRLIQGLLGCRIWHQNSSFRAYPEKPTCIILSPEKKFKITDLKPSTEYICKVSLFSCIADLGTFEAKWVTPSSQNQNRVSESDKDHPKDQKNIVIDQDHLKLRSLDDINSLPLSRPPLMPATPSKVDHKQDLRRPEESEYEYCVRVIKCLEREQHLSIDFRVKFLTWFSLKARMQERRVVSAFVDAMIDDPSSLAEQLIDTFADEICAEKPSRSQAQHQHHQSCATLLSFKNQQGLPSHTEAAAAVLVSAAATPSSGDHLHAFPKIIHTHPRDFMALVQKLTGMSSPPPPPSTSEAVSARVRRGNGAAAADNNCYINKSGKIGEGNVSSSFVKAGSCSESDWITAGIGSQVNSSWVFRHPPSSANNFFLPSKPALLRNSTDLFCRNSDQTSYYSNLNFNFLN
ncbi:hypothetical protein Nepgr_005790 [Nepenthes gracilis]|uniref:Uncharacterized protein n=1 Tax=Nepenthes gracilis TaxID=150966 RepID=A0AAD3S494_NEPGR|nr:hypothetical protein Nepgr_005790 [Nepenthes gracilis]